MNRRLTALLLAAGLCASSMWSVVAQARPLTPAERRHVPWHSVLPQCADPDVLGRIVSRFHQRETDYWQSGLEIVGYDRIRETGFRANGLDYIPRRYCTATALMNNGVPRRIIYNVAEDMDMTGGDFLRGLTASLTLGIVRDGPTVFPHWGVDWCVAGLDRNYAYGPDCRAAGP